MKNKPCTVKFYPSKEGKIRYFVGGEEFEALAKTLRENSERPNRAHFAVGACHGEEVENIYKAMQTADARMYEVKEEYYARHPEYEWHNKLR